MTRLFRIWNETLLAFLVHQIYDSYACLSWFEWWFNDIYWYAKPESHWIKHERRVITVMFTKSSWHPCAEALQYKVLLHQPKECYHMLMQVDWPLCELAFYLPQWAEGLIRNAGQRSREWEGGMMAVWRDGWRNKSRDGGRGGCLPRQYGWCWA